MIKKHKPLSDGQKIIGIDPVTPDFDIISIAGKIIQGSGVVIFPAQCLYGLAVNARDQKAVEKIFHLKQRPLTNPILILIPDKTLLPSLVKSIPGTAEKLMAAFWPGNLTLIFEAKDTLPELLMAGTGKIGIRIPAHPVAKALTNYVGFPITGTSANFSGHNGCNQAEQLDPSIIGHANLVLDAGTLKGGIGSTVVDVTGSTFQILREGIVSAARINEILTD